MTEPIQAAGQISQNLAPLVGCKYDDKRWSPRTALLVCKGLDVAGLICLNVDAFKDKGLINYDLSNRLTIQASNIHSLALDYSPIVLNPSYALGIPRYGHTVAEVKRLLYAQSLQRNINDSAIIDCIEEDKALIHHPLISALYFVILECFTLRMALFEYAYEGDDLNREQTNRARIDDLAGNIRYLKKGFGSDYVNLQHHLSTLYLNIKLVKSNISNYYIEV